MSGIVATAVKESMSKAVEKAKEMKNNVENMNFSELKETSEELKKVVQEADIETAKNSSLSSIIEANKEKQKMQENKNCEIDEGKEGLSDEQKKNFEN